MGALIVDRGVSAHSGSVLSLALELAGLWTLVHDSSDAVQNLGALAQAGKLVLVLVRCLKRRDDLCCRVLRLNRSSKVFSGCYLILGWIVEAIIELVLPLLRGYHSFVGHLLFGMNFGDEETPLWQRICSGTVCLVLGILLCGIIVYYL